MELNNVVEIIKNTMLNSSIFPYRTGQLRDNFFENEILPIENGVAVQILAKPLVNYGKILENAPTIRYGLREEKVGRYGQVAKYSYIPHKNRHFRYIDKIIDSDVVRVLESELGVKYENK